MLFECRESSRYFLFINPLSANPTKLSNTLKQFVGKLPTNCLSMFDHFVLLLKGRLKVKATKLNFNVKVVAASNLGETPECGQIAN